MKKSTFLRSLLTLLVMAVWGTSAMAQTAKDASIDFSQKGYSNAKAISEVEINEDIKVSFNKGSGSTAPAYYTTGTAVRVYAKGNFIVSAEDGCTITKITLAFGSGDKSNTITADTGNYSAPEWSGSANSVTFTIGGTKDHRRIKSITVEYTSSGATKETQTLAFSEESISIYEGETFTAPTVSGAQTTVTYSSSDEAVATVHAASGEVTIVGIGKTTITANAAEDETYYAASASYTLIVLNPNPYFYKKVVSLSELTEGTVCIFTGIKKDGFYAMGQQNSNNRTAINISSATTLPELISFGSINETNAPYEATIVMYGEKYCFQMSNGKYLINKRTNSNNYLRENNGTADSGARWTISLENEELKVYNDNSDDLYGEIRLNTSSNLFSCYKENSQEPITIYRRIEVDGHTTLNISAAGYATFTSDKNYIIPAGVEGGIVTVEGTTANVNYVYTEGDIVPANTGLLMKGAQGEYKMYATTQEATEVYAENLLKGALTDDVITAPAGSLLYIFANDSESGLGFYWQKNSNNGQQVQNMAGKAYLQVPTTSAVKGFRLNLGDTTGITAVESTLGNAPVYTLSGVRVNGSLNNLPAGIYIVGGKKVYVK